MTEASQTWSPYVVSRFLLNYHGLLPPQQGDGKRFILNYLDKVGCIQFDPVNICGRNADLVLQSRIKNYTPALLEELLYQDRSVIDGWDKMMALFRTDDFPSFSRTRREISNRYKNHYPDIIEHLKDYASAVRDSGPVSSLEMKGDKKLDWAWGSMRLAKASLEILFFEGKLSVHHRVNNRRYYDLTERLLPKEILQRKDPFPLDEEYRNWHVMRRIRSAGIVGLSVRDFWYGIAHSDMKQIRATVDELVRKEELLKIRIEDSDKDWYIPADLARSFEKENPEPSPEGSAVMLAPLDNMMWNRELIELAFGFRYRWEVYTPAAKREYGHYVLPILYRERLIARCEPVLDRKHGKLILKGFWPEEETKLDDEMIEELRAMFARFCRFLGVKRMVTSPGLKRPYRTIFKGCRIPIDKKNSQARKDGCAPQA